jgi:ketosteroid isomerase-like protein
MKTVLLSDNDASADAAHIRVAREGSNQAIANHDAEQIAATLDEDYQLTAGNGDFFHGTPAQKLEAWRDVFSRFDDVIYVRTPDTVEVSRYLPLAFELGNWTGSWSTEHGIKELGGRYSASWRKVSGHWKIRAELFVTLNCSGPDC